MKILRFNDDQIGILKNGDRVVDVSEIISHRAERGPQRVMDVLIEGFETYRSEIDKIVAATDGVALTDVTLLAPMPRPSKCLAAFVNYLDKPGRTVEQLPNEFFHKAPELVGPEGTIELVNIPAVEVYHAEAEFAFVMSKQAKHVSEADAMDYVFGYVPFFDVSARGMIRRSQLIPKGQHTFSPCGPWITTKDEIPDPYNLQVKSWVNGEARQNYSTGDMGHKIDDQISWVSKYQMLQPGDIIATGTHHDGIGPINVGDTLEIEIEKLGRARFFIKGDSPRKDIEWLAGQNKPAQPVGTPITIV
ncbi:MAG: fumarylacetoacetate hydrolase family protein [Rhodospirillaceae bacterium]|jgi:2-keto-4-pentenoate hydratase/2-oxohepta-3-ene-1,7-dioic acid hydratase in catechol pathway|nr:fumarylacetoacetate hydrolase family protein [Rhodospirillales bacterium]MBT3907493.1 fumarylacetoacetate hydrolase family protein [Rhodospirillaceae bacterium]MBT4699746.1 fumarylacetoacetate hydrolase family protein [Rhodospirillaceae bacterium]MBT5035558.1 fumarylacetoacetate hydrolase family protein [Rhodospirillaceae bacterium]MBT6219093.1 fumarylacetoacetate hydrolase family protein [Rhodospirillaceae bacterium]